jgi:hypothetical protein
MGEVREPDLRTMYDRIHREVSDALSLTDWAEDEIEQAQARHPEQADLLYHSFSLLYPTVGSRAWSTEFVVRGHARELLERLARGEDTRPATAAETCLIMSEVSKRFPLGGAAAGLYLRMWAQAFPDCPVGDGSRGGAYERIYGQQIDEYERQVRHKARQRKRAMGAVECDGEHFGEPAVCRYAARDARRTA